VGQFGPLRVGQFERYLQFIHIFSFFRNSERLHCRIPAAVGLLCVGFWRRVGGSAVFCEVFSFFLSTSRLAFSVKFSYVYPLSIFAFFT
jgi:hypothetical protein